MLIQVGQVERLRDECILFATRAATNAFSAHIFPEKWPTTHVQLEIYQDQVHVFQIFQFLKSSQVAMERACDFIQDVTMVPDRVKSSVSTRMLIGMDGRLIKKIGFDVGSNLDEHIESARL